MTHLAIRSLVAVCFVAASLSPALAQSAKDKKIAKKTDTYIRAINTLSKTVFGKRSTYARKFADWKVGPTCDAKEDRNQMYPFNKGFIAGWIKDLGKANKKKPKLKELEAAAKLYIQGLKALDKPWAKAHEYYKTKAHKKDNCAKGKTYHAAIDAAYALIDQGDRGMRRAVDAIQEARAEKLIKDIAKKYGKRIRYHHRKGMIDAKRALVVFETQWNAKEPDVAAVKTAIESLEAFEKGVANAATTYKQDANRSGFTYYARSFKNFAQALRYGLERIDGTKPFSKSEQKRMAERKGQPPRGSLGAVITSFNALVQSANRMRYHKKLK